MSSQYITVRETAQILAVSEKKVMDLIESGQFTGLQDRGPILAS